MPVVDKPTLKGYFNDGDVPGESEYIDFIDSMGDMVKTVYDTNGDGKVNSADVADNALALGGIAAVNYIQRESSARPGVTKLYRADNDSGYYLRHYWTGVHWYLEGYQPGDTYHAPVRVGYSDGAPWAGISGKPSTYPPESHTHGGGDITSAVASANNADTLDSLHASSFYRKDQDVIADGYDIRTSQGIYIGSTGVDPGAGVLRMTGNASVGGGLYVGSSSTTAPYGGAIETTSNILCNAQFFGRGSDHYFKATVGVGYANDVDTDGMRIYRAVNDGHIYNNTDGSYSHNIYINWYGTGSSYVATTRVGNGKSTYGNIHADNFTNESNLKSKKNIRSYEPSVSSIDMLLKMNPIRYNKSHKNADQRDRIGLIAEELIDILPEVVVLNPVTNLPDGIDYGQIVPFLIVVLQDIVKKIKE